MPLTPHAWFTLVVRLFGVWVFIDAVEYGLDGVGQAPLLSLLIPIAGRLALVALLFKGAPRLASRFYPSGREPVKSGPVTTNRDAALKFAEFGLAEQAAGRRESASGPGSSIAGTAEVRELLISAIGDLGITSILDLGCGDWNWMRQVMASPQARGVRYVGWDVHPEMMAALRQRFGSPTISFETADIFTEPIHAFDLVICRDVLFHVDVQLAAKLVDRIRASSSRYLLSTSFPDEPENRNIVRYLPIEGWGFHRVNLDLPPFDLAKQRVRSVEEVKCSHRGQRRFACLYDLRLGEPAAAAVAEPRETGVGARYS